jgi:hypothetical protein
VARTEWQAAVQELAEARSRHEITDEQWFSGLAAHPVRRVVRSFGFVPDLEFEAEAPQGNGPIIEVVAIRVDVPTGRARRPAR